MSVDPRLARARMPATATPPPPPPPPPVESVPDSTTVPVEGVTDGTNGTNNTAPGPGPNDYKLKFCTVCASNNNRSMEGHLRLSAAGYPVISFGTGSLVRLPGPTINAPNVYNFNVSSYDGMYKELEAKDPRLYRANGILNMLERNRGVKWGPERWQDWRVGESRLAHANDRGSLGTEGGVVDVVITCEERCWDAVVDDLLNRGSPLNRPVHVFNVDIKDSHEEALVGGKAIVDLADHLNAAANEAKNEDGGQDGWHKGTGVGRASFDDRVPDILAEWQERWPQFPALWTLAWF